MFDEFSTKANDIQSFLETVLIGLTLNFEVTLKEPVDDVARRLLCEFVEFKNVAHEKGEDYKTWMFKGKKWVEKGGIDL